MKKVVITAASNMSEETYRRICDGFSQKIGQAEFVRMTDDGIIGGFIAEIDGEIYDMSIASQLDRMQREITGNGGVGNAGNTNRGNRRIS